MSILDRIVVIDGAPHLKLSQAALDHIGYAVKGKGDVAEIAALDILAAEVADRGGLRTQAKE